MAAALSLAVDEANMTILAILVASCSLIGYPNPHLLAEPSNIAPSLSTTCIIDTRAKTQFEKSHIPGAIWIDASDWGKSFDDKPNPEEWALRLQQSGIGPDSKILVYGGDDVRDAARIWWILRYWQLDRVQLLNGGINAWVRAGLPVSSVPNAPATIPRLNLRASHRLETKNGLLNQLNDQKVQVVDARSNDEHCGISKTAKRNGKIPGAIHLEWTEVIDPNTKCFKSPEQLAKLFRDKNIDMNRPLVTYCQSGGRASVVAFALELMGGNQVRNYYKSWSEWGNATDTPIHKSP